MSSKNSFSDKHKAEKYLVVGAGVSGVAAAELLLRNGCDVALYDGNADLDIAKFREEHTKLKDVLIYLGTLNFLDDITCAVFSPGVPTDTEFADIFRSKNIPIIGEVELAYRFEQGRVVAITGTNGKTTTTALVGEIMKRHFPETFVVGNIGLPYTAYADKTSVASVSVAEISSFMLETVETFHASVSAILNITPDHLNRHHSMENYIAAKETIVLNQTEEDTCVLNYDDAVLREFGKAIAPRTVYFSSKERLKNGYFYALDEDESGEKKGALYKATEGYEEKILNTEDLQILGRHNFENACAAIAMGEAMGVPLDEIKSALKNFQAVEHRIEFVREVNGVRYYNDSKGTNPDAAIKAVEAMERRTVIIGGGYDKQSDYDDWIASFGTGDDAKVKHLVLIGETKEKIAECAKKHGFLNVTLRNTLDEAVREAREKAESGDAVLLSPACASWDMFKNYEVRGNEFKELVKRL